MFCLLPLVLSPPFLLSVGTFHLPFLPRPMVLAPARRSRRRRRSSSSTVTAAENLVAWDRGAGAKGVEAHLEMGGLCADWLSRWRRKGCGFGGVRGDCEVESASYVFFACFIYNLLVRRVDLASCAGEVLQTPYLPSLVPGNGTSTVKPALSSASEQRPYLTPLCSHTGSPEATALVGTRIPERAVMGMFAEAVMCHSCFLLPRAVVENGLGVLVVVRSGVELGGRE